MAVTGVNPGGERAPLLGAGMARTHIGDDGDEGVGDGEGEALRGSRLEALLHQGEAVLPTEQADVAQQVQRNLHVLGARWGGGHRQNNIRSISPSKS